MCVWRGYNANNGLDQNGLRNRKEVKVNLKEVAEDSFTPI